MIMWFVEFCWKCKLGLKWVSFECVKCWRESLGRKGGYIYSFLWKKGTTAELEEMSIEFFFLTNTSWHGQTGHGQDLSILLQQGRCVSDDFCCRPAWSGARLNFLGHRSPHQAAAANNTFQRLDTKCNIMNNVTPCHTVRPVKVF